MKNEKEDKDLETLNKSVPMTIQVLIHGVGIILTVICLGLVVNGSQTYFKYPFIQSANNMVLRRIISLVIVVFAYGFLVARTFYINKYNKNKTYLKI